MLVVLFISDRFTDSNDLLCQGCPYKNIYLLSNSSFLLVSRQQKTKYNEMADQIPQIRLKHSLLHDLFKLSLCFVLLASYKTKLCLLLSCLQSETTEQQLMQLSDSISILTWLSRSYHTVYNIDL